MKILIVDDNKRVRELIKRIVADFCDEIYECSDGEESLAAYDHHQPDWVLMDIEMERMDGLSATSQLSLLHPKSRIVIVSRYDDEKLREAAQRAGACAYLAKENLLELKRILARPSA